MSLLHMQNSSSVTNVFLFLFIKIIAVSIYLNFTEHLIKLWLSFEYKKLTDKKYFIIRILHKKNKCKGCSWILIFTKCRNIKGIVCECSFYDCTIMTQLKDIVNKSLEKVVHLKQSLQTFNISLNIHWFSKTS